MSISEMTAFMNYIRQSRRRSRLFDRLTKDERREFVETMAGDTWHLDDLLEDFVDVKHGKGRER